MGNGCDKLKNLQTIRTTHENSGKGKKEEGNTLERGEGGQHWEREEAHFDRNRKDSGVTQGDDYLP